MYVRTQTLYNAGWSHGKEKMGDKPDTAKASYYYNPIADEPGTAQDRLDYPLSYPCNKWPDETLLPGFRNSCCDLGKILTEACIVLSPHLDSYAASKVPSSRYTQADLLQSALHGTEKVKARLLYYYPLAAKSSSEDSWVRHEILLRLVHYPPSRSTPTIFLASRLAGTMIADF
jgi:hypothetical protein